MPSPALPVAPGAVGAAAEAAGQEDGGEASACGHDASSASAAASNGKQQALLQIPAGALYAATEFATTQFATTVFAMDDTESDMFADYHSPVGEIEDEDHLCVHPMGAPSSRPSKISTATGCWLPSPPDGTAIFAASAPRSSPSSPTHAKGWKSDDVMGLLKEHREQIEEQLETWMRRHEEMLHAALFRSGLTRSSYGSIIGKCQSGSQGTLTHSPTATKFRQSAEEDRLRQSDLLDWERPSAVSKSSEASSPPQDANGPPRPKRKKKQTRLQAMQASIGQAVASSFVEALIALAIFGNAILIGIDVQMHAAGAVTPKEAIRLEAFHVSFGLFFMVELSFRLFAEGRDFLRQANRYWNAFDCFLVLVSCLDFLALLSVLMKETETGEDQKSEEGAGRGFLATISNARMIRIIRITRVVRIMRINRLLRFVVPLRLLVVSILSTLWHLLWALLLLLILTFVYSVYFIQAKIDYVELHASTIGLSLEQVLGNQAVELDRYWLDVPSAMHTLFQSITNGVSWGEAVLPLQEVRADLVWVFASFISFSLFAVLNVMTGVFCQEAIENAQRQQDLRIRTLKRSNADMVMSIRQLFDCLDRDCNGRISYRELTRHCDDSVLGSFLVMLDLQPSDLWLLFNILDTDNSESIDFGEFLQGCLKLKGNAKAFDLAALQFEHRRLSRKMEEFMIYVEKQMETIMAEAEFGNSVGVEMVQQPAPSRGRSGSIHSACSMNSASSKVGSMETPTSDQI